MTVSLYPSLHRPRRCLWPLRISSRIRSWILHPRVFPRNRHLFHLLTWWPPPLVLRLVLRMIPSVGNSFARSSIPPPKIVGLPSDSSFWFMLFKCHLLHAWQADREKKKKKKEKGPRARTKNKSWFYCLGVGRKQPYDLWSIYWLSMLDSFMDCIYSVIRTLFCLNPLQTPSPNCHGSSFYIFPCIYPQVTSHYSSVDRAKQ